MIYILLILLAIIFFAKMSDVNASIRKLQSEINQLKKQAPSTSNSSVAQTSVTDHQSQAHQMSAAPSSVNQQSSGSLQSQHSQHLEQTNTPESPNLLLEWFKENWLLKVGVLMILVGFGWFVSYAFIHDWIGPVGRISIGIIAGALITIFGMMRLGKNQTQGVLFTILGSALVIISVLSGQYFYQFFSSMLILGIIFLISFFVTLTALAYSIEKLAIYSLIIALLAPVLSNVASVLNPVSMYLYLLVISIATVWVAIVKGWRLGNPIGIFGILLYSLPIILGGSFDSDSSKYITLVVAYVISLLYLIVSTWSLINKKDAGGKNKGANSNDVFLTIVSTIIILGFTMSLVPEVFQSLVLALWMLIYGISGFIVFQATKNEKLFYIHALVAVLFLAIATSVELSGKTLVIAFAIEAGIISIASYLVTNKIKTAQNFGLLMIVPMLMSLGSLASSNWWYSEGKGIFHVDFVVLLLMAIITGVLALFYKANKTVEIGENTGKTNNVSDFSFYHLSFIISSIYFYAIIWLSTHSIMFNEDTAVFVSLFIFTIVGLVTYFMGLFSGGHVLKKYGAVMLILVVIRLVLVDVWNMELVLRVVTFIVLGILFISTAFISKNKKEIVNKDN